VTLAKQSVKRVDRCAHLQPTVMNLKDSRCKRSKWSTMVQNAKTAYRIHQLEATSTRTVWNTIKHHNTHYKPILPLEGHTDFQGKCDVLRIALFPNTLQPTPLPPNLLTSKEDLRHHTNSITVFDVKQAIAHLKYRISVCYTRIIEHIESAPVETSAEEAKGEGSRMRRDFTPVLAAWKRTSGSESLGGR